MAETPITDHWWNRENLDGDDEREVGRLLSLKGLERVTQVESKALDAKTTEYAKMWNERGPHGEIDPNVLRHIWVYRGDPAQGMEPPTKPEGEQKAWIRIWEHEEVKRWMKESTDYPELPKRGDV